MSDSINHPKHYNQGRIEVIEFIEDKALGFNLGNVVKYVARAGVKDKTKHIEDLEKAMWYLRREIELLSARLKGQIPLRPNDMNKEKSYGEKESKEEIRKTCGEEIRLRQIEKEEALKKGQVETVQKKATGRVPALEPSGTANYFNTPDCGSWPHRGREF